LRFARDFYFARRRKKTKRINLAEMWRNMLRPNKAIIGIGLIC
jgi:hypothetical protein